MVNVSVGRPLRGRHGEWVGPMTGYKALQHSDCTLVADLTAPARIRRFVESRLGSFERLADALLAATELVSNFVQHQKLARSLAVSVESTADLVRIEVSAWPPPALEEVSNSPSLPPSSNPEQGKGLWIVDAVTDRRGIDSARDNTIWFEIDR